MAWAASSDRLQAPDENADAHANEECGRQNHEDQQTASQAFHQRASSDLNINDIVVDAEPGPSSQICGALR
ncbi:hypothetical protein [Brevundimonas sp. CEF1]|uniref:hypothetical protein n=1 Tax=Brevundimonas sp. CEF1 TaxID=3442642 RepID=UPI003F50E57F